MKCKLSLIVVVLFTILISGCSKENPQAVIIVRDTEDRLVKNAKVEIYSKPGNSILEDSDFTDEHGKSYHEFTFEGTFIVEVDVENYFNFERLVGVGEITMTIDEVFETTIYLAPPQDDPVEE